MLVYVVTELHVVVGVYTKERRALAVQEKLAREDHCRGCGRTTITAVQLNEEHDSGTQDESGEV